MKPCFFNKYYKSIVMITGLAMLFSCQPDLETIETITATDHEPIESVFDVKIIQSSHGVPQVIIETPQMDRYETNEEFYTELPKGINVVFFDSLQNPASSIKANYAISYEDKEIIEAKNDVVVVNEFNEQLNTEHLVWDQKKEIIYSDKFVKITTETEIIYGDGLEADERFEKWKVLKPRGTITIEEPINGQTVDENETLIN